MTRVAASPRPARERARPSVPPAGQARRPARPTARDEQGGPLAARYGGKQALARSSGIASYYSDALSGRKTANGERYDPRAFTAAHRNLPFGTVVRVVREDSGDTVYVRINDRGPFVRGRVLDLSRAAAERLDMIRRGIVRVRVEVVERGAERKTSRKKLPSPAKRKRRR